MLEEFSPDLQYIKGTRNVVADALSHLEIDDEHEIFNISECFGYDDDDSHVAPFHYGTRTSAKCNELIQLYFKNSKTRVATLKPPIVEATKSTH